MLRRGLKLQLQGWLQNLLLQNQNSSMPISSTGLAQSFFCSKLRQIKEKQAQHDKRFDQEDSRFNKLEEMMLHMMAQLKKLEPIATDSPTEPSKTYQHKKSSP